jgi:hypothetical protein
MRRRGLSPNQPLKEGELPLIYAAKKAQVESIEQLIKLGADVNSQLQAPSMNNFPSSLIAVCASEGLAPERVAQAVSILIKYNADPTLKCIMLTESEKASFDQMREEYQKFPWKEKEILAKVPSDWFTPRTALDFARKNNYPLAMKILLEALKNPPQKGIKDGQRDGQDQDSF